METQCSVGKQHHSQKSRTWSVHKKAVLTEPRRPTADAPTTSHPDEHKQFLQRRGWDLRKTKPLHDSKGRLQCASVETNKPYGNSKGKLGPAIRNERGNTLIEWATSRKCKIINIEFEKEAGRKWTWKNLNGVPKNEIEFILINRLYIVTVSQTVVNNVNIGSDHIITEWYSLNYQQQIGRKDGQRKLMNKRPPRLDNKSRHKHDQRRSKSNLNCEIVSWNCKNKPTLTPWAETLQIWFNNVRQTEPKQSATRALMKKRREQRRSHMVGVGGAVAPQSRKKFGWCGTEDQ